jgi:hypothetical protein
MSWQLSTMWCVMVWCTVRFSEEGEFLFWIVNDWGPIYSECNENESFPSVELPFLSCKYCLISFFRTEKQNWTPSVKMLSYIRNRSSVPFIWYIIFFHWPSRPWLYNGFKNCRQAFLLLVCSCAISIHNSLTRFSDLDACKKSKQTCFFSMCFVDIDNLQSTQENWTSPVIRCLKVVLKLNGWFARHGSMSGQDIKWLAIDHFISNSDIELSIKNGTKNGWTFK